MFGEYDERVYLCAQIISLLRGNERVNQKKIVSLE